MLDVLVVAPHPDDAELGLAGTMMKLVDEGYRVGVLDLTNGEPTPRGSLEIRARETSAATKILGIQWRENLGLPNRSLEASLDARRRLAEAFRRVRPRVLFAPYWEDAHPDHVAATQLVEAARFWSKLSKSDLAGEPFHPQRILYYYCVHLRHLAQPAVVVDISAYWERKRAAIACFESQFATSGDEGSPTLLAQLRDQAAYWGWSIGAAYGEPIASREAIGVTTLRGIV